MMTFILITGVLFLAELLYFRVADKWNIIDKPNQRSSHQDITLRGGGIIFPLSIVGFFLTDGFFYPWFMLGLLLVSFVSFADDVKPLPGSVRSLVQAIAVGLLCYQTGLSLLPWYAWVLVFIILVGTINAWNFMDGINGITVGISLVTVATLWYINLSAKVLATDMFIWLMAGLLVFGYFNARTKARCFAGDIGSVSMAFAILFLLLNILLATGEWLYLLLLTVYGLDSVLTILHRLWKRENIFDAHRQHLYQYLANEARWPHLQVAGLYTMVQLAINVAVVSLVEKAPGIQLGFAGVLLAVLLVGYIMVKAKLIQASITNQLSG
jgi:UDP-GlcNAc:undecaprenyl-phosphate/decaprenyl-phosphate GlcNAc-1-phosphate transferase